MKKKDELYEKSNFEIAELRAEIGSKQSDITELN